MTQVRQVPSYNDGMQKVTSFVEANEILRVAEFGAGAFPKESLSEAELYSNWDGNEHVRRRKLASPLFMSRMVDQYERQVLAPAIERWPAQWRHPSNAGRRASTDPQSGGSARHGRRVR